MQYIASVQSVQHNTFGLFSFHVKFKMYKAAAMILVRSSHPLVSLPVVLQVVETSDGVAQLYEECLALGVSCLQLSCISANVFAQGAAHATYCDRARAALTVLTTYCAQQRFHFAWLKEANAIDYVHTSSPALFRWLWSALADPRSSTSMFSPTVVADVLERSVPLSLHQHQFSHLVTFATSWQRSAVVCNVGSLWKYGEASSADVLQRVSRTVGEYLGALRVGFDLKALRWVEVHALLLCLEHLSSRAAAPLTETLDVVAMLLGRLSSGLAANEDNVKDYRPTTAHSRRIGRIGGSDDSEERRELVLAATKGCACFVTCTNIDGADSLAGAALRHHLWGTAANMNWDGLDLPIDDKLTIVTAILAAFDAFARLVANRAVPQSLVVTHESTSSTSDTAQFFSAACKALTNVLRCIPQCPPLELSAAMCSLIHVLSEIAAARATVQAAAWRLDFSPTNATVREQSALAEDNMYSSFINAFFEWEVTLSIIAEQLRADDGDDAYLARCVRRTFVGAAHWLCWNFVAVSTSSRPSVSSMSPLLADDVLDDAALTTISEVVLAEVTESGNRLAWRALGLLYHMMDLEEADAIQRHFDMWLRVLSDAEAPNDDAAAALCSFITQQRVNIVIQGHMNHLVDCVCSSMQRWPSVGALVGSSMLADFGASSLLTDHQLHRTFAELTNCFVAQIIASRKDRVAMEQCVFIAKHYVQLVASPSFGSWAQIVPDGAMWLQHVVKTLSNGGHVLLAARLMVVLPPRVVTPSEVAQCLQPCLMSPVAEGLVEAAQLLRFWASTKSITWLDSLREFCEAEVLCTKRIDSYCEWLPSPMRQAAVDLLHAVVNLPAEATEVMMSRFCQASDRSELTAAIVEAIRVPRDRSWTCAAALTLNATQCSFNGPRMELLPQSPPSAASSSGLPHFTALPSALEQIRTMLGDDVTAGEGVETLTSVLHALLFGPYTIDIGVPTDAASLASMLGNVAAVMDRDAHRLAVIAATMRIVKGPLVATCAAASAWRLVATNNVSHSLRSVWSALAEVLSAKRLGVEPPTTLEWQGLLPSFLA